jgi:sugar lactone lactonase YvrE
MGDLSVDVALHVQAQHAEGPIWDGPTERLWWVDIVGERVHCFDPASGDDSSWRVPGQPGGVAIDTAGTPIVATPEGLARLNTATGALELCAPVERDKPENRANDVKVDGRGRAWVGSMAFDKRARHAALHRVHGDVVTLMVPELTISNGPAFDDVAGRLYLADTADGTVDVFDFDLDSGEIRGRRPFLAFRDRQWWPDGMTVDDEGMLWLALGRAGAVHRYGPDGTLRSVVEIPTSNPTSVAFGGSDGRDLYITTSWTDLEAADRSRHPLAGAIFRCRPGVRGRPSPRFQQDR